MAVLRATHQVDTKALAEQLGGPVRLANVAEAARMFGDCEWGVIPAFGTPYGIGTVLDDAIDPYVQIVLETHTQFEAVRLCCRDFQRLEIRRGCALRGEFPCNHDAQCRRAKGLRFARNVNFRAKRVVSRNVNFRSDALRSPLRFAVNHLNQRLDVSEGEGERLRAALVAVDVRHVIRHHHAVVAHFLVDAQCARHVHVAIIGERLLEVEEAALDIAEVDVEDLLPRLPN